MLYLLSNLLGLVGLVGVFYLTGWVLERLLMAGRGLEPYPVAGRYGLGAAAWMAVVFVLAAGQLLTRPLLGLVALLTLVAVGWLRRGVSGSLLPAPRPGQGSWVSRLSTAAMVAVLVVLWLQALWPQISWDANVYHLTVPRLYLEHGGFYRIPFNVYSNWPLNGQLLFALGLAAGDYILATTLHFAFGLTTVLLLYRTAKGCGPLWTAPVAGILLLVNPVVLDEFRAAYVDLTMAFFVLLAFLFVHEALETREGSDKRLIVGGVFAGVVAGVKPTGVMVVVCLLALYLVVSLRQGRRIGEIAAGLGRLGVPAVLLLLPWVLKSWVLTGNPVYPFLYPLLGGPDWSVELGQQLRSWQQGIGMGRGVTDYLALPLRVILEGGSGYDRFDGRISPVWLVLIPLSVVVGRRRPLVGRSLFVAAIYLVLWALSSQQMRFLIPVLPLLALAGAVSLGELGEGLRPRWQGAYAATIVAAATVLLVIVSAGMLGPTGRMVQRYASSVSEARKEAVHPVYRFIDAELPAEARLLLLNTNHGFFCRRDFVADSFFEASQINHLLRSREGKEGIRQVLAELGITHIVVENRDRSVPWPRSLYDFLNDPGAARRLYRSPDRTFDVVEVVSAAAAPGS